jgi:hypothetical protein
VPAVVNFTSLANPAQWAAAGAGSTPCSTREATRRTLPTSPATPLLLPEFPPTSMAYAETQSMFCDSLLDDADWLKRYARNAAGEPIPDALIQAMIEARQPFRAFNERQIALVAYFERISTPWQIASAPRPPCWPWPASGSARSWGGEPAPAAGHPAPSEPGVGLRLSRLSAGTDGGGADPRLLPDATATSPTTRASGRIWPPTTGDRATA